MQQSTRFDPRLSGLSQQVRDVADPQVVYHQKARDLRAEHIDGALHLYRHDDILAINRHRAVLGNGGRGGSFGHDARLIPLEIDGADHRKWRRLLDPMFSPKQTMLWESQTRQLARDLIAGFSAAPEAELFGQFCTPLPCLTFLRLVGAPLEDLDVFLEFKEGVVHPEGTTTDEIDANMANAGASLLAYFGDFLARKRRDSDDEDDVIAQLIKSEIDGAALTELDLINILFLLMFAGLDTVTSSLSCILAWLGRYPAQRARLVDEPSLIPGAIEELLRYESPVPSGMRYPEEDIDLGDGLVVAAGEQINAFWAAANVDPTYYADPLTVDFDRSRKDHVAFASGTHRCLGSHLARLELRIGVEEMLASTPGYEVDVKRLTYTNIAVRAVTHLPVSLGGKD